MKPIAFMVAVLWSALQSASFVSDAKELPENSIYQTQSKWVDQEGKSLKLADLMGKPVAISMVYLSCQHTCPLTVSKMKAVEKAAGKSSEQMQFVLVSFDPKKDRPEQMKKFAIKNGLSYPKWRMITSANESDLRELSGLIDFKYKKVADDEFEHSLGIIGLNASGVVVGRIEGAGMKPEELVKQFKF